MRAQLPLTSVLVARLLLLSDAVKVMPLVIVAVVIAYVAVAHVEPRLTARRAGNKQVSRGRSGGYSGRGAKQPQTPALISLAAA